MVEIKNNPFYVLHVDCTASRSDIGAAAEAHDPAVDPTSYVKAHEALTSASSRLAAEMDWFPHVSVSQLDLIRACIQRGDLIPVDTLQGLSKLTAMQYNLSLYQFDTSEHLLSIIKALDEQFTSIKAKDVLEQINDIHRAADIGGATVRDIERELSRKRESICQQLSELLQALDADTYIKTITLLVKETIEPASSKPGVIIVDTVHQYEAWAKLKIDTIQTSIKAGIKQVSSSVYQPDELNQAMDSLASIVDAWHHLAYPLMIIINKSRMDRLGIQSTAYSLRALYLYLHEKRKTSAALRLLQKMRTALTSLNDISYRVAKDESDFLNFQKRDEEPQQNEPDNQQEDQVYSVRISGNSYVTPPFCTCCMEPTDHQETIKYTMDVRQNGTMTKGKVGVQMPLCPECAAHRKKFSQLSKWLCFLSILAGVLVSVWCYVGFHAQGGTALLCGAGITILFYFLFHALVSVKPLDENHSSRLASVQICAPQLNTTSQFVSSITFIFTNRKYAQAFQAANASWASSVTSSFKLNSAKGMPMLQLKEHKFTSLLGVLCLFFIIAAMIVYVGYPLFSGSDDISSVFSVGTVSTAPAISLPTATPVTTTQPPMAASMSEVAYSRDCNVEQEVYVDIISIEPSIGISLENTSTNTDVVCKCTASSGDIVWVYMSIDEYLSNIDSTADLTNSDAAIYETVTYSPAVRIHGIVSYANSLCAGLALDISSTKVIRFSSMDIEKQVNSILSGSATNPATNTERQINALLSGPATDTEKQIDTAASSPATKAPALVLVSNGQVLISPDYEAQCPLTIVADSSTNYYVYLEYQHAPSYSAESRTIKNYATKPYEDDLSFYLQAGKEVSIDVPIGVYKLYYATSGSDSAGNNFYGTKLLFGDNTRYYSADRLLTFYADTEYYNGHTITLKATIDGNFSTDPIAESQFPIR